MASFVLYKSNAAQPYHWVLKAPNGEVVLTSENYATESGARNGIRSVQRNCTSSANYRKKVARDFSPYFTLNAPENGQVIGTSEMYSSNAARDNGIESVKRYGTTTTVVSG